MTSQLGYCNALKAKLNQQLGLVSASVLGDDNACMLAVKSVGSKQGFYHLSVCLLETGDQGLEKAFEQVQKELEESKPKPITVVKIGRNDPCSCGSNKKYKKCCGKSELQSKQTTKSLNIFS